MDQQVFLLLVNAPYSHLKLTHAVRAVRRDLKACLPRKYHKQIHVEPLGHDYPKFFGEYPLDTMMVLLELSRDDFLQFKLGAPSGFIHKSTVISPAWLEQIHEK